MNEKMNTYEGMFLLRPGISDFEQASEPVRRVLDRAKADVLSLKAWDECRLAYEIEGNRRGLYVLTYFKLDPASMDELERDSVLSEDILRSMFLRRDKISDEEINAETPATEASREEAEKAEKAEKAEQESESGESPAEEESDKSEGESKAEDAPEEKTEEAPDSEETKSESAETKE